MPLPPNLSPKDGFQVLRAVMDDDTNRLRVDAEVTAVVTDLEIRASSGDNIAITNQDGTDPLVIEPDGSINTNTTIVGGELAIEIDAADGDNIAISNQAGTNKMEVNPDGSINITDNGGSITVDGTVTANIGTTGGLALDTSVKETHGSASGGTAATISELSGGIFNAIAPTLTDGQQASLQLDSSGNLKTTATVTVPGTVSVTQGTTPWVDNVNQFGGNNVVTGTGASGLGIPRVTVSNDSNILATQSGTWATEIIDGSGNIWGPRTGSGGVNWMPVINLEGATDGSPVAPRTLQVGGSDGVNIQTLSTNSSGELNINNIIGTVSLPTGAATSANQVTEIASLSSIDSKLNTLGQKTSANSVPVVIASDQSPITVTGTITTSPDVNVHDGSGVSISSTSNSLNVNVTNTVPVSFEAFDPVDQGNAGLPGDAWYVRITDGSNTVGITSFSLNTVNTNTSGAGAVNIQDGGNSITVDGTVTTTQGTSPWVVSGTVTANLGTIDGVATETTLAKLTQTQGSTTSGQSGPLIQGAVTTAAPTYTTAQTRPLSLTTAGGLRIDGSGTTQPVSGTVAVTQSTSPWVVSGTVTANAGTNLNTSALALDTTVAGLQVNQGSTTSGEKGSLIQGAVTTAAPTYTTGQTNPLSLTTAGALRTDSSATTQPVSGTVAATQSGIWTVQPGNTANTTPWLVTDSSDGPVTPGTVATKSSLGGGQYNSTPPTLTNGQQAALQFDVNGNLKTNATVTIPGSVTVTGNVASGATDSGNPVKTGGVYNSTTPTFTNGQRADTQVDTTGATYVNSEGQKATYSAAATFTPAALLPTDVFTITGSATKTIRIQKISINGTNTGNTNAFLSLIRRSSANTGGTSTTLTNVPADSTQAAGTATVRTYTVNPTLGTTVGAFRTDAIFLPTLASTNAGGDISYEFGAPHNKAIVLRGISEVAAVNVGGVTIGGTTVFAIDITWTEE